MAVIYFLILILLCLTFAHFIGPHRRYWKDKGVPFREPCPLFGNVGSLFTFRQGIVKLIAKFYNDFSKYPYVGLFRARRYTLLVRDLSIVKAVLVSDFNSFCDRTTATMNKKLEPVLHNLNTMSGDEWREMRRFITPFFSNHKIKLLYPTVDLCAIRLSSVISKSEKYDDNCLISDLALRYVTDTMGNAIFDTDPRSLHFENTDFCNQTKLLKPSIGITLKRYCRIYFPVLCQFFNIKTYSEDFSLYFSSLVKNKIEEKRMTNLKSDNFLQMLIESKNFQKNLITKDDIISNLLMFIVGGLETTTSALTFCLYELVRNPEVQQEVRKEVYEKVKTFNGFTYETLISMKLLHKVLKESMRLYPPVPFVTRLCTSRTKLTGSDLQMELGHSVLIPIYAIHRDPNNFKCPDHFDLDRSDNEFEQFLTFGKGPRSCIGASFGIMVVAAAVARIVYEFVLEPCDRTPDEITFDTRSFILKNKDGLWIRCRKVNFDLNAED